MECVRYVGWATSCRATVKICLYVFKKKKKKGSSHFAPYGVNPPHTHPRATEILVVVKGTLYVGFVTSNPDNRLFTKTLYAGDVFVFSIGFIHF
jgi:quercetin dioxygenase-like cupin family protein